MRNNTAVRTVLGALFVAGAMGAACSTHSRHSDTTVAQAPLGLSTADYPANPSVLPPDAAQAPEQSTGPVHALSPGAARGSTQGAPINNPPTTTPTRPAGPDTEPNGTAVPPPTPASPNAPSSTPAPNPIPPTGGGPTSGTGTPAPPPTTEESASTLPSARGTFLEPLDPYQARSDGGIAPPIAPRDGGVGGRGDAGGIGGGRSDAGVGGVGRGDAGVGFRPRGDGGLR